MQMEDVRSSQLQAIGYDLEKQVLRITFKGGATYEYFDVPPETHKATLAQRFPGFKGVNRGGD